MDRKEDIILTYLRLGAAKGFQAVSLSDIAMQVGISKASIFSHFKGFDEIRDRSFSYCRQRLQSKTFLVDFSSKNARSVIEKLTQGFIDTFTAEPLSYYFLMLDQLECTDRKASLSMRELSSMITARFTVALDYCNQRSWTDIDDTDFASELFCTALKDQLKKTFTGAEDFETAVSGLLRLLKIS